MLRFKFLGKRIASRNLDRPATEVRIRIVLMNFINTLCTAGLAPLSPDTQAVAV